MKSTFFSLLFVSSFFTLVFGQQKDQEMKSWFHKNYSSSGIYGVGSDKAISFLEQKGLKPVSTIVAVLDSGVDIFHEDLDDNIWVNTDEIPDNGKDDDNNGYIDDVNGWNFIGNKDGKNVTGDNLEITRLYAQYKEKFEGENESKNKKNIKKFSEEYKEYLGIKTKYLEKYNKAKKNYDRYSRMKQDVDVTYSGAVKLFGGEDVKITPSLIKQKLQTTKIEPRLSKFVSVVFSMMLTSEDKGQSGLTLKQVRKEFSGKLDEVFAYYESQVKYHYNASLDTREIVGDNYEDKYEIGYGNNDVKGPDSMHGTHVAGIIAGERENSIGTKGVAGDHIQIMSVRTVPDGDERDKDVANAIKYAADNGAKIVNMSFGKGYSPYKEVVWEAIQYAGSKGVLMVHAAGNDDSNIDITPNFPTNYKSFDASEAISENYITIGASTRYNDNLKASFSNYGKKQVDIFAPGLEIYSTTPENTYQFLQGTSMAAPVFSGCAALLWSYFPDLKAEQVKDILFKTASTPKGNFSEYSNVGAVVNVYKAVQYAYQLSLKK